MRVYHPPKLSRRPLSQTFSQTHLQDFFFIAYPEKKKPHSLQKSTHLTRQDSAYNWTKHNS